MTKIIPFLCLFFIVKFGNSQTDSSDYKANSLYLYRTEEDFFNKKKSYRGQFISSDNKIIDYTTTTSKKRKLNLEDSCSYYFGYQIGDEIQIRPDKKHNDYLYYVFGGGSLNAYCVVYGHLPNYDKQGYLLGVTAPGGRAYLYFNDRTNKLNMVQLNAFLKSKPKLLQKYENEKKGMDKELWERNKLEISIKYLKLFIADSK